MPLALHAAALQYAAVLQYATALWDASTRMVCSLFYPITGGGIRVVVATQVEDLRFLDLLDIGSNHALLSLDAHARARADVMFVLLPNGHYALLWRDDSDTAAVPVSASTQLFLYEPTLAIRLFDTEADVQLQLTIETTAKFWLLVECFGLAKEASAIQDNGDDDASAADAKLLEELVANFEEYMECRVYTSAELLRSEQMEGILWVFLLGILFRFCVNLFRS